MATKKQVFTSTEAIKRLKHDYFISFIVSTFFNFLTYWFLFFGIIIIIFRQIGEEKNLIYWLFSGIPIGILFSANNFIKQKISDKQFVAAIDAYNKAGGILMFENETNDNIWHNSNKSAFAVPELYINWSKSQIIAFITSLLFLLASFFVPIIKTESDKKIDLTNKTAEIKNKIEILEQEKIIEAEEKQELEKTLDSIFENSNKETPGITFEAIDQINNKLQQEASEEINKRIKNTELLKKLEDFARKIKENNYQTNNQNSGISAKDIANQLRDLLKKYNMSDSDINDYLNKYFKDLESNDIIKENQMSDYAEKLSSEMNEMLKNNAELAQKLLNNDLLERSIAESINQALDNTKNDSNGLDNNESVYSAMGSDSDNGKSNSQENGQSNNLNGTNENTNSNGTGDNAQSENIESNSLTGEEGNGNASKDNFGKTSISYGKEASDYNAKFHNENLPNVNVDSIRNAKTVGLGVSAPTVNNDKDHMYNSLEINNNNSINGFRDKNILPKYKNTVKKYFEN